MRKLLLVESGLDVKTKFKSFLSCTSFVMLLPISSEDKPQEAYHTPSKIDVVSGHCIFL